MSYTSHSLTESPAADTEASTDELLDVLGHARRRAVLTVLADRSSSMGVEQLAHHVAARERESELAAVPDDAVEETHVTLHHVHLPKLDEADLVDHDREDKSVTLTGDDGGVPIDIE